MRVIATIILLLIAGCTETIHSQTTSKPHFARLTTQEGLSNNFVNCITQDSSGFIWIGTQDGLNRYDAKHFKIYRNDPLNQNSLSNNYVTGIAVTRNGNIWIGTEKGLCHLDPRTDSFTIYKNIPGKAGSLSQDISPIPFIDKDDNVWVATANGLNYFNPQSKTFTQYDIATTPEKEKDPLNNSVIKISEDKQGRLWCLSVYKICVFDKRARKFLNCYAVNHSANRSLAQKDETHFFLGQWGQGLFELDISSGKFKPIDVNPLYSCLSLLYDTSGTAEPGLYIGTSGNGAFLYDPEKNSKVIYQTDVFDETSFLGEIVMNIFRDRHQRVWFATNNGICILDPRLQFFNNKIIGQSFFGRQIEKFGEVTSFYEKNGNMYFGVWPYKGIYKFTKSGNLLPVKGIISPQSNSTLSKSVYYFFPDKDQLWLCTDSGLIRWNEKTGESISYISSFVDSSINRSHLGFRKIISLDSDNFLIRTWNWGLLLFNKKQLRFTNHFIPKADDSTSLPSKNILDITALSNNDVYITTPAGLCRFLPGEGKFIRYAALNAGIDIVPLKKMNVDAQDNLWITSNTGLFYFDTHKKKFTQFTTADGLAMNICNRVYVDKKGKVWITTNVGISRFDPVSKKFLNFSSDDGLAVEMYDGALGPTEDNQILAGFTGGYTLIDPERNPLNENIPPVKIAQVKVMDKDFPYILTKEGEKIITLDHDQNFIQVSFSVLNFTNPKQNKLWYRLEGFDREWHLSETGNIIYTNLPPGKYKLKLKGANNSGIVNENADSLLISISPAYWQTWWFLSSVALLTASLFLLFVRRRINSIRKESALKQKISDTEMMALRAQMNPHFIFNCLTSIDNLIQNNEKEKATIYLSRFAKLIRNILENSKNITIPCWKDLETLQLYIELEELRCDKKFNFHIAIDPEILQGDYKVPPLIIQPFVENAIRHGLMNKTGDPKELKVSVHPENNFIHYKIEDNGVGRQKAAEYKKLNKSLHRSLGINISMQRIHLVNGKDNSVTITDLVDAYNQPCGTLVQVVLMNQN
ncbi:MAG: histidine kinase [Chitinophagaceae bacterium]|nr:histidine kinase [Chitinophagaceae bacterium]